MIEAKVNHKNRIFLEEVVVVFECYYCLHHQIKYQTH